MAYTKHTWQCGESISADLLNHMEQGIEDASGGGTEPLIVTATKDGNEVWTLDKTYNEIKTAVESGRICVVKGQITVGNSYVFTTYVSYLYVEEGEYFVNVFDINSSPINLPTAFWATSADGYPMYD